MGLFTQALTLPTRLFAAEAKTAVGAAIPTWQSGTPVPMRTLGYERTASQGYMANELIFAVIEYRATSAAEPRMTLYRQGNKEKVEEHPALKLLARPNPFLSGYTFWASILMHMDIGGNAYVEKVYSKAGKLVELWLLRPDRVTIIPDQQKFVGGYRYTVGPNATWVLPPEQVIHFKTRHPLDDFYGLPPMHVLANRIDLDTWTREFVAAFFRNAGVPAGLLNIMREVDDQERELIRQRFRQEYGGPQGWHNLMVVDGGEATYTQMGASMGQGGYQLGEYLNEMTESRVLMCFGMAASLISTVMGAHTGQLGQAGRKIDAEMFWRGTLAPIYRDFDETLTNSLKNDYPDVLRFEHDLSTVQALQEDQDAVHARYREDLVAGMITREEARLKAGYPETPDKPGTYLVPIRNVPTPSDMEELPAPGLTPTLQAHQEAQQASAVEDAGDGAPPAKKPLAPAPAQPALNGATRKPA